MLKVEKINYLKGFTEKIKDRDLILVNYEGMTVKDISEVRTKLRETGSAMAVIKNTLLKRSLENQNINLDDSYFKGMSALVTVGESFSDAGKAILEAEKAEKLKIKGGYFEGNIVDDVYVKKLASIPSKDILYGMLVGCLQGPIANLVYTLQGIAEKKENATAEALDVESKTEKKENDEALNVESKTDETEAKE